MIEYNIDNDPTEIGVYACRVPDMGFSKDIFLLWFDGRWSYVGSDQRYRGHVNGWIGPLQRKLITKVSR